MNVLTPFAGRDRIRPLRRLWRAAAMAALAVPLAVHTPAARATIKIDKKPPEVTHREFDPANPPADLPHLEHGEDAVTRIEFETKLGEAYSPAAPRPVDGGNVSESLLVSSVNITITASIVIWTPIRASEKLKAHEEGHRLIAEKVYATADKVARAAADLVDGRHVVGIGATESEATSAAMTEAQKRITDAYSAQVSKAADRINQIYDALTAHGTRIDPDEKKAIDLAFAQYAEEVKAQTKNAASRPSSRPAARHALPPLQ